MRHLHAGGFQHPEADPIDQFAVFRKRQKFRWL
jgi:hypothetical protein